MAHHLLEALSPLRERPRLWKCTESAWAQTDGRIPTPAILPTWRNIESAEFRQNFAPVNLQPSNRRPVAFLRHYPLGEGLICENPQKAHDPHTGGRVLIPAILTLGEIAKRAKSQQKIAPVTIHPENRLSAIYLRHYPLGRHI